MSVFKVGRICIRICDDCRDWFKPDPPGPDNCPNCGKNGLRWVYMVPEEDDS